MIGKVRRPEEILDAVVPHPRAESIFIILSTDRAKNVLWEMEGGTLGDDQRESVQQQSS
jgi:hypothetical protein